MSSSDDDYQLGTPVVSGSDNWLVTQPDGCKSSLIDPKFVVTEKGWSLSGSSTLISPGQIFIIAQSRCSITNRGSISLCITATNQIFPFSSQTIAAGGSFAFTVANMSISASGSLAARDGGPTSPILSVLDVTICPTDIDVHPLC